MNAATGRHHSNYRCCSPLTLLFVAFGNTAHADGLTFVHTDHLGTPVAYTNGAGDVIGREYVTPYGESLNPPTGNDQPAFTSHVRDGATGLVYMQARYYDPVTGRMLSADPVEFSGGGVSHFGRYHYANGNPVNLVDPTGMIAHREDAFDCSNDANCKDMTGGGAATRSASSSGTGQTGTAGNAAPDSSTGNGGTTSGGEGAAPTTPDPVAEIAGQATVRVRRFSETGESTIGELSVDGTDVTGYTLEPPGPSSTVEGSGLRISAGEYALTAYSSAKYPDVFLVNDVTGRSAILIHSRNLPQHTEGCLLPGTKTTPNAVWNSGQMLNTLRDTLSNYESIRIIITDDF